MVTFEVGKGDTMEAFQVLKEFVYFYSPVLNIAFRVSLAEGVSQLYTLDNVSSGTFRLLIQWLYSQKISTSLENYVERAKRLLEQGQDLESQA